METFQAHSRPVWAVGVSPGRRGFATGSADHNVKFWEFELISDEDRPGRYGISKIDNIINKWHKRSSNQKISKIYNIGAAKSFKVKI